ncbi:MAG: efflux RND transporter periplasmic adaptor subunit [Thiothrix sp.]|nr:MAG: efflux RND transporter periplasmic adaptor subunit [Thiothrix sp.]
MNKLRIGQGACLLCCASLMFTLKADMTMTAAKSMPMHAATSQQSSQAGEESYICPMHPHIHQDEHGTCPICGMDLVQTQRTAEQASKIAQAPVKEELLSSSSIVTVKPESLTIMGLKTAKVEKKVFPTQIETYGTVAYNEDTATNFVARTEGWVDKLHTLHEGIRVKKGDTLLDFYSPDLLMAQDGFVVSLKNNFSFGGERQAFFDKVGREKLRLYGLTHEDIEQLAQTGELKQSIPLKANQDGIITEMDVDQGDFVDKGGRFMVIADMRSVWVYANIPEQQIAQLDQTNQVEITSQAFPDLKWQGKIDYVGAALDPSTNMLKVRLLVETPDEKLKPNMRVTAHLHTEAESARLVVPNEAIIPAARNEYRIVKAVTANSFQTVSVKIGRVSQHYTEILSGLEEGEQIVAAGQFLLDAESNLQASLKRL